MSDIITLASGAVIILVFLLFCFEERKLYSIKEILVKLVNSDLGFIKQFQDSFAWGKI